MSTIRFKPLMGAWDGNPVCYLLEIDSCRILLDCGWDDSFNLDILSSLKEEVEKGIDAVLISQPDLQHLGALPYAVGKLGMRSKIYSTIPVKNMGQMFLYDAHVSLTSSQDFDTFALDDVDLAFNEEFLVPLKYSQRASISTSSGSEIEIIPYAAGHMIGGTFWKIRKETEEIIYAVDFNHKKENLLKPAELENFSRPSLLITGTSSILAETDKRNERDSKLSSLIMETISQNGNVLIPIDTAGRVLEILMILDQIWAKRGLNNVGLVFLNNFSDQTIEFAKISVEWMSDQVMKRLHMDREKPFSFEYVKDCQTMEQIAELKPPYVVLASSPTLECGFSRDLFVQFAAERRNLILFTSKQRKRCLASDLMENAQLGTQFYELEIKQKVALEGEELEEFKLNLERKKEEKDRELLNQNMDDIGDFIGEIEEDEPEALIPLQPNPYFESSFDLIVGKDTKAISAHPMFPFVDEHLDWDEYGEQVIIEDFKPSSDDVDDDSSFKENMETEEAPEMMIPKKSIVRVENVVVNCKIEYLNYEGKSDARSIKEILTKMAPRKIILINGEETCNAILQFCSSDLKTICNYVAAPQIGEIVDVTSDTAILNVKLSDSLMNSIRFDKMKGYDIAYFNSIVKYANDEDSMDVEEQDNLPRLESIAEDEAPGHDAVFVGDLLLQEFKKVLTSIGYHVELSSGVLVCNGVITLQKVGDFPGRAKVNIEGPMCDEYYVIRDLLYQQFCIF